jgi:hypothetical protein
VLAWLPVVQPVAQTIHAGVAGEREAH